MADAQSYDGVDFTHDFSAARREDGARLTFTRNERRILVALTQRSGALCTRNALLDVIAEPGSDSSDRNIDFTINRLRGKIGDDARAPRFIATRYGEGYVWIAKKAVAQTYDKEAFIIIGPVRGLAALGEKGDEASAFVHALRASLAGRLADGCAVVLDPDRRAPGGGETARFGVELTFVHFAASIDCIVAMKSLRHGGLLMVQRRTMVSGADGEPVAQDIADALWQGLAGGEDDPTATAAPLALRIHQAAEPFRHDAAHWEVNDATLRRRLDENPGDAVSRLMLATNIHSKYIMHGWRRFLSGDPRRADEDELERLLLGALPALQENPQHALSAAKLLMFLDRGLRRTAVEMAEEAFPRATAAGHALAIMGQMRVFLGDTETGVSLLEQARGLSEPGSQFDLYLLVMLCQAHMASDDVDALGRSFNRLCRARPLARGPLGLVLAPPDPAAPSLAMRVTLRLMTRRHARALLMWSHYVSARLFSDGAQRRNAIMGLATLLRDRFGDGVISQDVAALLLDQTAAA